MGGVTEGMSMAGVEPVPVGASRMLTVSKKYSILVSLMGEVSGNLTINMSEHAACFFAGKMLCEEMTEVNEEVLDGICEIGNLIAGSIKGLLEGSEYQISSISVPALIVGANYSLYHYRGFTTASVEFEVNEIDVAHLQDRFMTVALSLMKA